MKNPKVKTFEYHINKDERGEFNADVRNPKGKTVWQTDGDVFEDGYMKHKDDMKGLKDYLVALHYMNESDILENCH
jgi:hypothetical protein